MSNWSPDPGQIIVKSSSGTGNMGTVSDETSVARFGADMLDGPWVLSWLRGHFAGTGSGTADLQINVDSRLGEYHDTELKELKAVGVGADVFYRTARDDYEKWVFQPGDVVVITWINPDGTGNLTWGAEAGLAYAR